MYRLAKWLFRPYTLLLLLMFLAVAFFWWRQREARRRLLWLIAPLLVLAIVSTPAVAFLVLGSLEWSYPPTVAVPQARDTIVVLTGSVLVPDAVRVEPELGDSSLYRCQHAAALYRRGQPCMVLVTGGKVDPDSPGPPCSEVMRDYLVQLGVKPSDIRVEAGSRNTYESAVACREILQSRSDGKVFLVTEATHMARSHACFTAQGIEVIPAPCAHRATEFRFEVGAFLPSVGALRNVETAAHEWIGMTWYWVHGRI